MSALEGWAAIVAWSGCAWPMFAQPAGIGQAWAGYLAIDSATSTSPPGISPQPYTPDPAGHGHERGTAAVVNGAPVRLATPIKLGLQAQQNGSPASR